MLFSAKSLAFIKQLDGLDHQRVQQLLILCHYQAINQDFPP
jgi:hypothetical protein